jgi:hypothetical protein
MAALVPKPLTIIGFHAEGQIKAYENDAHLNPDTPHHPL